MSLEELSWRYSIAGFEDGERGSGAKECEQSLEVKKRQGNIFFPRTSKKEHSPANTLILVQ